MPKDDNTYDIQENLEEYVKDYPDKEVRIINAAINTFSEKGFERTKTKEIAQKAGVAEGTIFRYFPTKDAILERMVPLLIRVMQPKLEKPIINIIEDTKDKTLDIVFSAILIDRIRLIRENERFLLSVLPALAHRAPLLNQLKENVIPIIEKYIEQVLASAKARGEIKEAISPEIVISQMMGFVVAYSIISGYRDEEKVIRDVKTYVRYAMEGWRR